MTRKQRKYNSGGKALGMSKHRESGISGPSRRTKEWMAREINSQRTQYRSSRMFSSMADLMRGRKEHHVD